jgi:PleD family two-component response regulator
MGEDAVPDGLVADAARSLAAVASVLVVEDDLRIREALARALADAGYSVRT